MIDKNVEGYLQDLFTEIKWELPRALHESSMVEWIDLYADLRTKARSMEVEGRAAFGDVVQLTLLAVVAGLRTWKDDRDWVDE